MIWWMPSLPPSVLLPGFHFLACMLIGIAPVGIRYFSARIRASPSGAARLFGYRLAIVSQLFATVAVFFLIGPATLFAIHTHNRGVSWLPSREIISIGATILVLLTALPILLARRNGPFRVDFLQQLVRLRCFLPQTRTERLWFAAAAVCAAACDEVLYRGFLLHYLHVFPWHLNIAASLVISCAVYGVLSLHQSVGGLLQTVLLALGMALLFLSTRSLLSPIVLHVIINVRVVLALPTNLPPASLPGVP
jgi:membrane protease YdiL (CAAX protease family)